MAVRKKTHFLQENLYTRPARALKKKKRERVCIPAKEVPGLSRVGISLQRFLQTLDSIAFSAGSVPKLFDCVMHPAWNTNRVVCTDGKVTHRTKCRTSHIAAQTLSRGLPSCCRVVAFTCAGSSSVCRRLS